MTNIRSHVSGTFTATGRSDAFKTGPTLPNWQADITVTGPFVGSVQLERSMDGGTTWAPMFIMGTQYYIYTAPAAETFGSESIQAIYSFNCTAYTSGTISYWIIQ